MSRPSAATNSLPPPRSTLSVSQISSTSGVAARNRPSVGNMSARSTACGFGLTCLSRTRAAAGVSNEMSRLGSDSGTQRDAAVVGFRARDQILGGAHAGVPGAGGREAVVDQQRERRLGGRGRDRRIPQRAGGRDDDQRGERQPQQRQPPRRALRRLLLGRDVEQEPRRREVDAPRLRRDEPQQPPQHRQAQQPEQHQRLREAEREPRHHAAAPVFDWTRTRRDAHAPGSGRGLRARRR